MDADPSSGTKNAPNGGSSAPDDRQYAPLCLRVGSGSGGSYLERSSIISLSFHSTQNTNRRVHGDVLELAVAIAFSEKREVL